MKLRLRKTDVIRSKLLFQKAYSKESNVQSIHKNGVTARFFLLPAPTGTVQVAFIVSKRNFRRAHERNHIKRLLREGHRLNIQQLQARAQTLGQTVHLFWSFRGKPNVSFHEINTAMQGLISRILEGMGSTDTNAHEEN